MCMEKDLLHSDKKTDPTSVIRLYNFLLCPSEFSKEKEKAQSRGDFQRLRAQQQLEEDLQVRNHRTKLSPEEISSGCDLNSS